VEVGVKVCEFVWEDIGIRDNIEIVFSKALLHLDDVEAESIFSGQFIRLGEVVNFLIFG
jgi:hypothetical protein